MTTTADLAARLVHINDAKAQLDAEAEQIKAQLRALGVGPHQAGAWTVTVSVQRRFDPALGGQRARRTHLRLAVHSVRHEEGEGHAAAGAVRGADERVR